MDIQEEGISGTTINLSCADSHTASKYARRCFGFLDKLSACRRKRTELENFLQRPR